MEKLTMKLKIVSGKSEINKWVKWWKEAEEEQEEKQS